MVTSLNNAVAARDIGFGSQTIGGRVNPSGAVATYSVKLGRLPAGAIILTIVSDVETAITGTTPTFNIGTTAAGTDIVSAIALTAGNVVSMPAAALVQPLAAATDVWANVTGTATGDAYVIVNYVSSAS